jgi:hypothetical protein
MGRYIRASGYHKHVVRLTSQQLFSLTFFCAAGLLLSSALSAWSGPPVGTTPPDNNVAAPVNIGTSDQVKNAGLSLNSLAVFGGALGVKTQSPVTALDVAGSIKLGNGGELCQAVSAGVLRWNATSKTIDFCNGTEWKALSTTTPASSPPVTPQTYTYSNAGTYAFAIPQYNTMRVRVWGGGGGGGASNYFYGGNLVGGSGGTSSFNYALYAYGGSGGGENNGGAGGSWAGGSTGASGATAVSCTSNRHANCPSFYGLGGNSPNGGAGGDRSTGGAPGGGGGGGFEVYNRYNAGGGGGGYSERTYSAVNFMPGAIVTIVVGAGGNGVTGYTATNNPYYSYAGARGWVQIIVN